MCSEFWLLAKTAVISCGSEIKKKCDFEMAHFMENSLSLKFI